MSKDHDSEVLLSEILSKEFEEAEENIDNLARIVATDAPQPAQSDENKNNETYSQWSIGGNGRFIPVGATVPNLKAGVYEPFITPGAWGLERLSIVSDGIHILPDMATETVLKEVQVFWSSEHKYRKHGLLYKRGIILWGPPGGGKTVCVKLLINELIKRDGLVIIGNNIQLTHLALKAIRRIEPRRNLIVVFEDIDEIIRSNREADVLSLLDGEGNIDNVLNIATTNYPDRLGGRIINRPSRFDRRVHVGMPSDEARRAYLNLSTGGGLDDITLDLWVKDTKDLSIAHLRELIASVYCLDNEYNEVIKRLKEMTVQVKPTEDGFARKDMGFISKNNPSGN